MSSFQLCDDVRYVNMTRETVKSVRDYFAFRRQNSREERKSLGKPPKGLVGRQDSMQGLTQISGSTNAEVRGGRRRKRKASKV